MGAGLPPHAIMLPDCASRRNRGPVSLDEERIDPICGTIAHRSRRRFAMHLSALIALCLAAPLVAATSAQAQLAPSTAERAAYTGLFAAGARGDAAEIARLAAAGADPRARDGHGRTPLHVAAYASQRSAMRALVGAGLSSPQTLTS